MESIGVIGAGAWGTALAQVLSKGGRNVTIWALEPEVAEAINAKHENTVFLAGISLDKNLKATNALADIVETDVLLIVSPAQFVRSTLEQLKTLLKPDQPIVLCSKGVELDTGMLLSQVVQEVVPNTPFAILTGPTFASEIAQGLPGAVTISSTSKKLRQELRELLGVDGFRPYITDDVIGTQLGGAIKNVIAIASGILTGRKKGESSRAALLTRGVAEIARLGVAMGARKETLLGMCGIGDLFLTATSVQSRNFSLGLALGEGKKLSDILKNRKAVTEGVYTAESVLKLAKKYAVDMPISEAVDKVLKEKISIDESIEQMLNRPFKYAMSKSSKAH